MSRKGKRRISFQVLILETQNFPGLDSKMEAQGDRILYQPLRDWCCQEQGPSAEGCLGISGVLQGSWSCVHNLYRSLVAGTNFTGIHWKLLPPSCQVMSALCLLHVGKNKTTSNSNSGQFFFKKWLWAGGFQVQPLWKADTFLPSLHLAPKWGCVGQNYDTRNQCQTK